MTPAQKLRNLLAANEPFIAPGCYDALTALAIERAGFGCAYLSGASVAFTRIGRPDIGLTTMTEVADTVANICARVEIPLIVDGDTGFGNALNVQRTVRTFERMGAAGIQLEDQTIPKRCGHLEGKQLTSIDEMCGKIRAALDARHDKQTVIVARTDAIAVSGIDDALERGAAYAEAGADILFVESPRNDAELARLGAELGPRIPLLANMVEGGKTPLKSISELSALGFKMSIFPGAMVRTVGFAAAAYLDVLKRDGTTAAHLDQMLDFAGINEVVGTAAMLAIGAEYASGAAKKK